MSVGFFVRKKKGIGVFCMMNMKSMRILSCVKNWNIIKTVN